MVFSVICSITVTRDVVIEGQAEKRKGNDSMEKEGRVITFGPRFAIN